MYQRYLTITSSIKIEIVYKLFSSSCALYKTNFTYFIVARCTAILLGYIKKFGSKRNI